MGIAKTDGEGSLLERGFEYFPSPEIDDDEERIAYLFLYCSEAVKEWPRFRRELQAAREKSPEQCDHIEIHAIDIFREVRDTIATAINSDNMALLPQPRLLDRLVHAHAFMALHADPASLLEYRRSICPRIENLPYPRRLLADFMRAVWAGRWNEPGEAMPAEVTYSETLHNYWLHKNDGRYDSRSRLDRVATAGRLDPLFPASEPMKPLSAIQLAFVRERLRVLGKGAGLSKAHADFLVRIALDGAKQNDNPSAWRAIRDRHRTKLMAKVGELLTCLSQSQN